MIHTVTRVTLGRTMTRGHSDSAVIEVIIVTRLIPDTDSTQ